MTDTNEMTIHDIVAKHGITANVVRDSPDVKPIEGRADRHGQGYRCRQCHSRFNLETGKGLKPARRFGGMVPTCCHGCGTPVVTESTTRYIVTLTSATGRTLTTPYTMGSAYMFGPLPDAAGVLDSLRLDASLWVDSDGADDFIRNYCDVSGATEDVVAAVRKGEDSYRTCGETYKRLAVLLGSEAARDELMQAEGL